MLDHTDLEAARSIAARAVAQGTRRRMAVALAGEAMKRLADPEATLVTILLWEIGGSAADLQAAVSTLRHPHLERA